jgi:8-oxo-dGTP pyrophosphatase MutT (NUDIX family)
MPPREDNQYRQAAAVCYRGSPNGPVFLLVRTFDGKWTFPKGQIDFGMTESEAAENEAHEEAGVTGSIEHEPFTSYRYVKNGASSASNEITVNAFLLAVGAARPPLESFRNPEWFEPEEAKQALTEGRSPRYALELTRVVDAAVTRLAGRNP